MTWAPVTGAVDPWEKDVLQRPAGDRYIDFRVTSYEDLGGVQYKDLRSWLKADEELNPWA